MKKKLLSFKNFLLNLSNQRGYMKAWQLESFTGIDGLFINNSVKIPPVLKPSEVLVKVLAASVNPLDTAALVGYGSNVFNILKSIDKISIGKCDDVNQFPLTVGRDFVGEVVRVGQKVSNVKVNEKVWGVVMPHHPGSHAQYVIVDNFNVAAKPENLSDVEAASLPYVALTGWSTAVISGGLTPNDCYDIDALILGASGGVGSFLTQLLSCWGARVTGVCSPQSFDLVQSLGATDVYDYNDPNTKAELISRPRFNLIINASSEADELYWHKGLKEWNNASYVCLFSPVLTYTNQYGFFKGAAKSVIKLFEGNRSLSSGRFHKWAYFMPNQNALKEIGNLVTNGKIRPVIDKVYTFDNAREAYLHMRDGPRRGKIVIDFTHADNDAQQEVGDIVKNAYV